MAQDELAAKLSKRMALNGEEAPALHAPAPLSQRNGSIGSGSVSSLGGGSPPPVEEVSSGATDELRARLSRRSDLNEGRVTATGALVVGHASVYSEFADLGRAQVKRLEAEFRKWDEDGDGRLCIGELKGMMEGLGAPQTHLGLKAMMAEVDEDGDGGLSFREFLLIFRRAVGPGLEAGSGLAELAARLEVDVSEEGVGGAKDFFEAKIAAQTAKGDLEQEILKEQERAREEAEAKRLRRAEFDAKRKAFAN